MHQKWRSQYLWVEIKTKTIDFPNMMRKTHPTRVMATWWDDTNHHRWHGERLQRKPYQKRHRGMYGALHAPKRRRHYHRGDSNNYDVRLPKVQNRQNTLRGYLPYVNGHKFAPIKSDKVFFQPFALKNFMCLFGKSCSRRYSCFVRNKWTNNLTREFAVTKCHHGFGSLTFILQRDHKWLFTHGYTAKTG